MQIITEIPDGKPGRPDNQRSRFLKCQPGRDLPKKTEVATGRKRINPEKPDVPINKNDAFQKVQKRRVQEKR